SSRMPCSFVTVSPTLTRTSRTSPVSIPSPRLGSFTSMAIRFGIGDLGFGAAEIPNHQSQIPNWLGEVWVNLIRIHAQVFDGPGDEGSIEQALLVRSIWEGQGGGVA